MKTLSLIFIFFASFSSILAQDSIVYKLNQHFRVINNTDFSYKRVIKKIVDSVWEQLDYHRTGERFQRTLFKDEALKTKHGRYNAFSIKGNIAIDGFYENDKPIGIWYFNKEGKVSKLDSLDYSFYSNLKKQFEANNEKNDSIVFNENTDKEAQYPGGIKAWNRYLTRNLSDFSDSYNPKNEIVIMFMIDKWGKLINVNPVKSISPIIDLEIINIIRKSPDWSPAFQNGKKVFSIFVQPITL